MVLVIGGAGIGVWVGFGRAKGADRTGGGQSALLKNFSKSASGSVTGSEHVSPRHRTLACGALSAGLCSGILLGSLVARAINASFDEAEVLAWAWRLPFIVGGVFGLLAMVLRRKLHETPVFAEMQQRRALDAGLPLKTVLREHGGAVLLAMLLTWLLTAAVVVTLLMMPTLLQGLGVSRADALSGNTLAIAATVVANIIAGLLADRTLPKSDEAAGQRGDSVELPFLGQAACFNDGPFRLAALLRRKVFFMAGLYLGGSHYEVRFEPLADFSQGMAGAERETQIRAALETYVARLEALCREHPHNWFNFHDFWLEDAT